MNASAVVDADYHYAYDFDDIGKRLASSERVTNFVYAANRLNQYTEISDSALSASPRETFTPTYDDDGNQTLVKTATGIWHVTYNGENRPILWECVTPDSNTQNSNTQTLISMSYDRMGRRVTKNAQWFVYDGYLQIADNNGNAYVWDPMDKVSTRPLTWLYGSSVAYYTHDGNKNVSEVVLAESTAVAHYEYAPFGETTVARGERANQNLWRFSSEYGDDSLGLVHYNFRCYAPMLGSWMSRDPVVEDGSSRLFLGNDPLLTCDVLGLSPLPNVKVTKWDTAKYDAHEKEMDANSAKYYEAARNSKEPDCSKYGLLWQKICVPTGSDLIATVNYHTNLRL